MQNVLVTWLVEHSRHFGPVRSLSLPRGAHFEMARAALSLLWACHIAFVVARCSFGWSRGSCAEILTRRSPIQSLPRDLVQRVILEILYRDLARTRFISSYGDLVQRHCIELCCRDLAQKSLTQILQENFDREFVQRSHKEIVQRDL